MKRVERRIVLGNLTNEYRVSESRKATVEDIYAGRSENGRVWVGKTEWMLFPSQEAAEKTFWGC